MRCPRILASTALALALAAPVALAQDRDRPARQEPVTTYGPGAFEPSHVEGTVHRPDDPAIRARRLLALDSLLRVRTHFRPELLKSVERL
jgi:hypothetical protein